MLTCVCPQSVGRWGWAPRKMEGTTTCPSFPPWSYRAQHLACLACLPVPRSQPPGHRRCWSPRRSRERSRRCVQTLSGPLFQVQHPPAWECQVSLEARPRSEWTGTSGIFNGSNVSRMSQLAGLGAPQKGGQGQVGRALPAVRQTGGVASPPPPLACVPRDLATQLPHGCPTSWVQAAGSAWLDPNRGPKWPNIAWQPLRFLHLWPGCLLGGRGCRGFRAGVR